MTILVISVDLECCRCRAKITRVLDCLKEEFCIEKIEFEDKLNLVIVRGKFSGEKLSKIIFCKAGRCVKEIKIVEVWPPPKPDPPKPTPPKPDPPKPEVKLVPYPYPLPYPLPPSSSQQGWPWCPCPPQQPCQCPLPPLPRPWCQCPPQWPCQCPPPRPPCPCPPPRPPCRCPPHKPCQCDRPQVLPWPPRPPHCSCSNDDDGCSSGSCERPPCKPPICWPTPHPICWPPPPGPGACPPWWCIEENPAGCSIM